MSGRSSSGHRGFAALATVLCIASAAAAVPCSATPVSKPDATASTPAYSTALSSVSAVPTGTLYDNTGTASTQFYAGQGGHEAIDDLHLLNGGSLDSLVFEYYDPAGGGTFSATVTLYGNPSGLDLDATPLLATYAVDGLSRGRHSVSVAMANAPVVSSAIWVGIQFSSTTAGLIINSVPSVGFSHDLYLEDGGFYNFGGTPLANFALRVMDLTFYRLDIGTVGSGLVTKSADLASYAGGTTVGLTATPSPSWHFVGWSGNAAGSENPLSVLMDADKAITATFAIDTYSLAYSAGPNGTLSGAVLQTVNRGADGTPVTANPDAGYAFTSWSDGVTTATRTDLGVTASLSVVASFARLVDPTITAGFEGGLAGWKGYGGGGLRLSAAGAGHAGSSFAALVTGPSSKTEFGITDSPRLVVNTGPVGRRYRVSAWVRSDIGRGSARLRVREYNDTAILIGAGSSAAGSSANQQVQYSPALALSTGWQELVVELVTQQAYSSLDLQVLDRPQVSRESFLVDDVTLVANAIPDQAPMLVAPTAATVAAGSLLSVDIGAVDPDGQAITTLSASTFAAVNPQTFTAAADNQTGRLTWTAALGEVGNTYSVTFTAQNALSATATLLITVVAPPATNANLCGNGTFEVDTLGWGPFNSATLSRVADGHAGAFAMQVRGGKNTSKFGCDDNPNWVQTTVNAGAVYRCSLWVKSPADHGSVRIQLSEFVGSQLQGTTTSNVVTLTPGWQLLTLDHTVRSAGSALSIQVRDTPVSLDGAETFLVDDVSIVRVGEARAGGPSPLIDPSAAAEARDLRVMAPTVYPNPGHGAPTLAFLLPEPGVVRAEIYDMAGRRVRVLAADTEFATGTHRLAIQDEHGGLLGAGIYFYRVQTAATVRHGRFVILE